MAGFKTHIAVSGILGAGYGAAAFGFYDVHATSCVLAGGLCCVSGMLPDIDSGPGVPLRESMAFAAAVVPMMLLHRLQQFGMSSELIILTGAGLYLLIRFGVAELLRRYTHHRGMFHSLPAAVIFGELAFLLATGSLELRIFKGAAVSLGYLSHLILDEFYSFDWQHGLHTKRSFGTAVKVFGQGWWPNLSTFAKLAILTFVAFKEPGWTEQYCQQRIAPAVEQVERTAEKLIERVVR